MTRIVSNLFNRPVSAHTNRPAADKSVTFQNSPGIVVHDFFDLNSKRRLEFFYMLGQKSGDELNTITKLIAALLKKGIVGYEYLNVNNKPYKSFITTQIGSQKLYGKKLYTNRTPSSNFII